jgi:arylsulfatase A-like enzyme
LAGKRVAKTRPTLPMHFKKNGYKTGGGGKLYHASSLSADRHTGYFDARPWDEYFPSKTQQMPFKVEPKSYPVNGMPGNYAGRFDWAALDIDPDEMADAKVVAWAKEQLSQVHDQPLFLAVGIYRPHIPWWTPKKYFDQTPWENVVRPEVIEHDLDDVPGAGRKKARQSEQKWMVENDQRANAVQGYQASVNFAMIGWDGCWRPWTMGRGRRTPLSCGGQVMDTTSDRRNIGRGWPLGTDDSRAADLCHSRRRGES